MAAMSPDGRVSRGKRPKSTARADEVTRLELENLYAEIDGLTKGIRRLESDLRRVSDRLTNARKALAIGTSVPDLRGDLRPRIP